MTVVVFWPGDLYACVRVLVLSVGTRCASGPPMRRTPCLRCRRTFEGRGSYCPSCRQYPGRPTRARRTDGAKQYGPLYERNRALILRGDPPCHWCRTAPATVADHLVPYSRGGTDELDNLVPACVKCNQIRSRGLTPPAWGAAPR